MVFFFGSSESMPPARIYMGRDKYENEDLIKYAIAEDFWFHVSDLSSAHVYLKPQAGWTLDTIPEEVLVDCAQLVKANSIEGNKASNVKIVYTPASNLRKENGFDVGQVAFHNAKLLRYTRVEKRLNEVVNRLNKTKEERTIDFEAERQARLNIDKQARKAAAERARAEEQASRAERKQQDEMQSYGSVFKSPAMTSNKTTDPARAKRMEEDFF